MAYTLLITPNFREILIFGAIFGAKAEM